MKNKLLVVISALAPLVCVGGNKPVEMSFENGEIFKVNLSKYDFNRLFVKGEKITKARFSEGSYKVDNSEVDEDEDDGAVYLKPTLSRVSTMYISTDKGHTFGIEGVQDDVPGKSFNFEFKKPLKKKNIKKASRKSKSDILHMVRLDQEPKGYNRIYDKNPYTFINKSLKANLISHYVKGDKEIYKYQISNLSKSKQKIPFKAIKSPSVIRYFIERTNLAPGESTVLVSLVTNKKGVGYV